MILDFTTFFFKEDIWGRISSVSINIYLGKPKKLFLLMKKEFSLLPCNAVSFI